MDTTSKTKTTPQIKISSKIKRTQKRKTTLKMKMTSKENFWLKMNISERWPSVEDDLKWKSNFNGRRPSVKDDLPWWLQPMTVTAELSPNQTCYQLSKTEIEFCHSRKICVELCLHTCAENMTFLSKDNKTLMISHHLKIFKSANFLACNHNFYRFQNNF